MFRIPQKIVLSIVANALAIYGLVYFGFLMLSPVVSGCILAGIIFSLLNIIVRPLISLIALPFVVLTLGLVMFLVNGLFLFIIEQVIDQVSIWSGNFYVIGGVLDYIIGGVVLGIFNTITHFILQ